MTVIIKGVHIPADETKEIALVEFDRDDFSQINHYVGGDFSGMDVFNPEAFVFFHDEAKILNLPLNRRATLFWWIHRPEFQGYDALLGDVLILGPGDDNGDTGGVPDELIELFFNTDTYRYMVKTYGETKWSGNGVTYDNWVDAYNGGLDLARRWSLVEKVRVVAA